MQMHTTPIPVSSLREVAPGVMMGLPQTFRWTEVELEGSLYDVAMELDLTSEGVRPTSVTVTSRSGGPPVSSTTMRALRVGELTREAVRAEVVPGRGDAGKGDYEFTIGDFSEEEAARLRGQGPTEETLKRVAFFYSLGDVLGLPPARHVELSLGIPRTTASKWVRRAREKGLLDG